MFCDVREDHGSVRKCRDQNKKKANADDEPETRSSQQMFFFFFLFFFHSNNIALGFLFLLRSERPFFFRVRCYFPLF